MYTIFKNDQRIILTDESKYISDKKYCLWSDYREKSFSNWDFSEPESELILFCDDLKDAWNEFIAKFMVIEAGGGIVRNTHKHFLVIFRNGKWDLPKGKIEAGESMEQAAMREVEEECGVKDLELGNFVDTSYHIYLEKDEWVLKLSHWYEMQSDQKYFQPQNEEGISEVRWIDQSNMNLVLQNTYPNIVLLLKLFI